MTSGIVDNIVSNSRFEEVKEEIKKVYLADDRPWVVGYSGGKDSTTVVQLMFQALLELDKSELTKPVYIISSDTKVETPLIIQSITKTLGKIQDRALELNLPIETHKVTPELDKSFWVSIIGKGYPTPRQKFRWCTDRMKIEPANKFIKDKVSKFGEVVMLLGVRNTESATRAAVMESHTVEGKLLMRHSTLTNAYVYAPIRDFTLDEVWEYLLQENSPWGDDNHELVQLYQNSNSECPLVVDKEVKESAGSCGNSRFGCWTCTVVSQDKAVSGFIKNGEEWMKPLLMFRNWLADIRDNRNFRQKCRMNGEVYLTPNLENLTDEQINTMDRISKSELGSYIKEHNIDVKKGDDLGVLVIDDDEREKQLGLGPFTLEARAKILKKLLKTQNQVRRAYDPNLDLIGQDEIKKIRQKWLEAGDWENSVPDIYYEMTHHEIDWEENDRPYLNEEHMTDLERLCIENDVSLPALKKLISVEKKYAGYKVRRGVYQEFDKVLKQQYLHLVDKEAQNED